MDHLNGVHPTIEFTFDLEKDGSSPFLDTHLTRVQYHNGLDVTVYWMPTHTDWYLDCHSHHPIHVKRGLVRCLHDRANSVNTS